MEFQERHVLIKRLIALSTFLLLVNFLLISNTLIMIIVPFFVVVLIVLDFYFLFTRKKKGPISDKPKPEITSKVYMNSFALSLLILMVLGMLDLLKVVSFSVTQVVVSAILFSAIGFYLIDEYYSSKKS